MKKRAKLSIGLLATAICIMASATSVQAKDKDKIENGIYVDDICLAGMTEYDAEQTLDAIVSQRNAATITLIGVREMEIPVQVSEMGLEWKNKRIVGEAASLGKTGNVIKRYKDLKDLEKNNKVYSMEYVADKNAMQAIMEEKCSISNVAPVDATLTRENEEFVVTDGVMGYRIEEDLSVDRLYDFITTQWDGEDCTFDLSITQEAPRGSAEEFAKLTDILGTFTTSFTSSGASRSANVTNGCNLINGTLLYPGDEFSTYNTIAPFSVENGYFLAGSYLNGQVVESLGGGICQVSTTLYNAVLLAELQVSERHNHSMIINYVEPSADAAISESAGKDFRFINSTEYPIYIEGYAHDKHITFNIYGVETRDSGHEVSYESVVLEKKVPEVDKVYTDAGQPAGYHSSIQSAHIGYKAELWKTVYENGVQVSREQVNSSTYNQSPRSITIGVATDNPDIYNALMAAAASGSADQALAAAQAAAGGAVPDVQLPEPPSEEPVPEE